MPTPDRTLYEVRPKTYERGTVYRVSYHAAQGRNLADSAWADILVYPDENSGTELLDWYWFGTRKGDRALTGNPSIIARNTEKLVWQWLMEWELVELRLYMRSMPEEGGEYIATTNLLGGYTDLELENTNG